MEYHPFISFYSICLYAYLIDFICVELVSSLVLSQDYFGPPQIKTEYLLAIQEEATITIAIITIITIIT